MKLQVAIDRKSLAETTKLVQLLDGKADIIEFGTSLVKDFGMQSLQKISNKIKESQILYDIKTYDEGAYEFESGFNYGADYLTVIGSASEKTIVLCNDQTSNKKKMMIDLTDVPAAQVAKIEGYSQAIYLIHHNNDSSTKQDLIQMVEQFHQNYPNIENLAVAGGIDLKAAQKLRQQELVDIIVVGGAITQAVAPLNELQKFIRVIKGH